LTGGAVPLVFGIEIVFSMVFGHNISALCKIDIDVNYAILCASQVKRFKYP
jgi:hypothetical protein